MSMGVPLWLYILFVYVLVLYAIIGTAGAAAQLRKWSKQFFNRDPAKAGEKVQEAAKKAAEKAQQAANKAFAAAEAAAFKVAGLATSATNSARTAVADSLDAVEQEVRPDEEEEFED